MNILITGGAGFIASHIVDSLIERGHKVTIVDNLTTGNIENVNRNACLEMLDIMDSRLESIFRNFKPHVVYHFAAQVDVHSSLENPFLDANINILGTIKILEYCKEYRVRKVIYASSAAVYGTPQYLGVDESHVIAPISFYGISKHTPEQYIRLFSSLTGIDFTILRFANVYGARHNSKGEGGVVSIFFDRLLKGEKPVIYGNGEQSRDFIYVKDIVSANIAALDKGSQGTFNISRNEQTSINNLLGIMCNLFNVPFNAEYLETRTGDILHSRLDNKLAITSLNWTPQYSLTQGLSEIYAKLKQELKL